MFDLPVRHGVGIRTVQTISQGLMVAYDAVKFYEQTLLRVEQQLHERTETDARLIESLHQVDELSSIIQSHDSRVHRLEEMRISAENAHRDASRELELERQAKAAISRVLETRENQFRDEISELIIDRQEAVLRYEFACQQHSAELTAIRADNQRLRQQLYEAYRQRGNFHQMLDEISSGEPEPTTVPPSEFISMQNSLLSMEAEHTRLVLQLDESQAARRELKEKLSLLRERYVALDKEKNGLTMHLIQ